MLIINIIVNITKIFVILTINRQTLLLFINIIIFK